LSLNASPLDVRLWPFRDIARRLDDVRFRTWSRTVYEFTAWVVGASPNDLSNEVSYEWWKNDQQLADQPQHRPVPRALSRDQAGNYQTIDCATHRWPRSSD